MQHLWIYMEAIFSGSGDIAREMPAEVKRFANIDRQWIKIMKAAAENPNVIKLCCQDDMLANLLPHLRSYLEMCQKSLSGYLEAKRVAFPRFYFVSDSQLLEILGQAGDPYSVQPHLLSISSNIAAAVFDAQGVGIVAMRSAEGEQVSFSRPVPTSTEIVDWLNALITEMQRTMKDVMRCVAVRCACVCVWGGGGGLCCVILMRVSVLCSAVQCNSVQCSAVQCRAVQCCAVSCRVVWCRVVSCCVVSSRVVSCCVLVT